MVCCSHTSLSWTLRWWFLLCDKVENCVNYLLIVICLITKQPIKMYIIEFDSTITLNKILLIPLYILTDQNYSIKAMGVLCFNKSIKDKRFHTSSGEQTKLGFVWANLWSYWCFLSWKQEFLFWSALKFEIMKCLLIMFHFFIHFFF